MLYAARAALSEREAYAKTHAGTWHELRRWFVDAGALDPEEDEAEHVIGLAERFLAAIRSAIGAD